MVVCLEWGADLHMAQLTPLPFTASCFSKIQKVLPFWYRLTCVVPDKGPLNGRMYVCYITLRFVFVSVRTRQWRCGMWSLARSCTVLVVIDRPLLQFSCSLQNRRHTLVSAISPLSHQLVFFVIWPTVSCFTDRLKCCHVTFIIIECWMCRQLTVQYCKYRMVTWPCITASYPNWSPLTCVVLQQYL